MKKRTKEVTYKIMSAVKSKDTKPEVFFRKALWRWGVRYRKNVKLFGKPDIAIKKYKLVIFIDGDFWHGNNWKIRKLQSLETELDNYSDFWKKKILSNIEHDKKVNEYYNSKKWNILRFWQSDIEKNLNDCIIRTLKTIDYNKIPRAMDGAAQQ